MRLLNSSDYLIGGIFLFHQTYASERTYFSNIFTKKMGCSPKQFLMKYRMEQAQKLLSRGYSVTTTAISVGYSDVYTFSKMFKQQFGQSPSRYQENVNE